MQNIEVCVHIIFKRKSTKGMTSDVCVNAVFDSKEHLKQSVLLLTSSTPKNFRVGKTSNTQYLLVCYSNKLEKGWRQHATTCKWRVKAKPFTKGELHKDGTFLSYIAKSCIHMAIVMDHHRCKRVV